MRYIIEDDVSFNEFKSYVLEDKPKIEFNENTILIEDDEFILGEKYSEFVLNIKTYQNDLIYGKDKTLGIVGIEIVDSEMWLFKVDGSIEKRPFRYWSMAPKPQGKGFQRLQGNQHYQWIKFFGSKDLYYNHIREAYSKKADMYHLGNLKESAMVLEGLTFYKGIDLNQLGILAFDIESEGLTHHSESNVFLITNVFKKKGEIVKKHFRLDHYKDAGEMIDAWCKWVQEVNPDIITGHNINGYDLPYLNHVAKIYGTTLALGRDLSDITFASRDSEYRVDGSQSWSYRKVNIFGRQVIDGMFLAVKYDIERKYESWGLKAIAEKEGFVKDDRQFYDASLIGRNWNDPIEREKIVQYGIDDAMDSLQIFELISPSYFMLCKMIPKPFQILTESASGSWLNLMMVRAYLQDNFSIPKSSEALKFEGALSYGNPGIYSNCFKIDIQGMYPSIIRQYKICDTSKDPKKYILEMTNYFFETRIYHKKLGKETGSLYHIAMDGCFKICANSLFGFLGAQGLNFNYPEGAAEITRKGREILEKTIVWATGKKYEYWENIGIVEDYE